MQHQKCFLCHCLLLAVRVVLQLLHHGAFMVLLHAAARVIFSCVDHALLVGQLLEATLSGINTPARCAGRKHCAHQQTAACGSAV
jgi:hypothetical protein